MANLYNSHLFPPPALTIDFAGQDFRGYGVAGRNFEDLISFTRAGATAWTRRADGKFYAAPENSPRWGEWAYNVTTGLLEPAGLLIEGARTNLCLQSHRVDGNSPWSKSGSPTFDSTGLVALLDGKTPYKFTNDNGGTGRALYQTPTTYGSNTFCACGLFENIDALTSAVYLGNQAGSTTASCVYTWGTNTAVTAAGSAGALVGGGAVKLGIGPNGGQVVLVWIAATATTGSDSVRAYFYPAGTPQNALSCITHNTQCEIASFPGLSPIPTDAAAVTRAADVATVATAGWFADGQAGTLLVDGLAYHSSAGYLESLSIATAGTDYLNTYLSAGRGYALINAASALQMSEYVAYTGNRAKVAFAWGANDGIHAVNGVLGTPDASVTLPAGIDRLTLGARYDGASPLFGYIRSLRYWPRRLSNTIIQALTA
jgi:hypothetical protein